MYKKLTIDDLKLILAQDEIDKLSELSLDSQMTDNINKTIDMISNMWRSALSAKGYMLDIRPGYIPDGYQYWVLVHARWAVWTRFPQSATIALDDSRKAEYEQALKLLEKPYIDVEKPEWENDPRNPDNRGDDYWQAADSIVVPYPLAFPPKCNIGAML